MICIYSSDFEQNSRDLFVTGDEFRHLKAFRANLGEDILVTNGMGLAGSARLVSLDKNSAILRLMNTIPDYGELQIAASVAIPILENRERFEYAVEKSVELGVMEIFPYTSKYTQRKEINHDRLNSKCISAIKQCNRSRLPVIHKPVDINSLLNLSSQFEKIIVADLTANNNKLCEIYSSFLFIAGPEGGFSENERKRILGIDNIELLFLGNRILRTETAITAGLAIITNSSTRD